MMYFVLVILFFGGTDGGRAIDTTLKFTLESQCEAARDKINANTRSNTGYSYAPILTCVAVR